jgi:formate--tetrahydrofolate ligase
VSIGIPSLVSVELACARHDVVIVEAGYGTDAGAQKWLDIAAREFGAQWPAAAVVVTRASTWRDDPSLRWRYPFHINRLEGLGLASFPLINLWEGEDDQVPQLREQAADLGFRNPIVGNLFRDGGDALSDQLDAFIDAIHTSGDAVASESSESHRGMDTLDDVRWIIRSAYGVPPERVVLREGFEQSLQAARELCASLGKRLEDMAVVAVKSPATMTDDDHASEQDRTVTLKKVEVHAGAGLVQVNLTSSLTTPMPKIV